MKVRGYVGLLALAVLSIGQIWASDMVISSDQPSPVVVISEEKKLLRPKALPEKRPHSKIISPNLRLINSLDGVSLDHLKRRMALRKLAELQGLKIFKHDQELQGLDREVVLNHLDLVPQIEILLMPWAPNWLVLKELYSVRDGADIRDFAKPSDLQVKRCLFLDPQGVLKRNFTQLNANPLVLVDRDNYQRKFGPFIAEKRRVRRQAQQILLDHGIGLALAINLLGKSSLRLERYAH